jgi:2-haloacid dehalogenase
MRAAGAGALAGAFDLNAFVQGQGRARFRAVAFDAFPIFDPRPIAATAEAVFPGHGAALSESWRTRQFEYTWLRSLSRQYADFWQVTEDALVFAAAALHLDLDPSARQRLMHAYLELQAWPDVQPALTALRAAGVRLALLSNFTPKMLTAALRNSSIEPLFDHVLSTDTVRTFKPDPRAYALGLDAFKLPRPEILFAPFAGWDAAGARWFGYPTFWVNRLQAPSEQLGDGVDGSGAGLADLVRFALAKP